MPAVTGSEQLPPAAPATVRAARGDESPSAAVAAAAPIAAVRLSVRGPRLVASPRHDIHGRRITVIATVGRDSQRRSTTFAFHRGRALPFATAATAPAREPRATRAAVPHRGGPATEPAQQAPAASAGLLPQSPAADASTRRKLGLLVGTLVVAAVGSSLRRRRAGHVSRP